MSCYELVYDARIITMPFICIPVKGREAILARELMKDCVSCVIIDSSLLIAETLFTP
jgi:hypothetical protein